MAKQRTRMLALLDRVATDGPPRSDQICHQIRDEIYELIHNDLRVLWFYDEGRVVICTHGFVKKRQKTPKSEIERAIEERKRYLAAKKAGTVEVDDEEEYSR